ncbi:MAG TPA: hypothetical protein DCL21_06285 [Alphaproteobacteria bacterium]|nr:hypothetical protein [Alphaproteobacteria bacterium]
MDDFYSYINETSKPNAQKLIERFNAEKRSIGNIFCMKPFDENAYIDDVGYVGISYEGVKFDAEFFAGHDSLVVLERTLDTVKKIHIDGELVFNTPLNEGEIGLICYLEDLKLAVAEADNPHIKMQIKQYESVLIPS